MSNLVFGRRISSTPRTALLIVGAAVIAAACGGAGDTDPTDLTGNGASTTSYGGTLAASGHAGSGAKAGATQTGAGGSLGTAGSLGHVVGAGGTGGAAQTGGSGGSIAAAGSIGIAGSAGTLGSAGTIGSTGGSGAAGPVGTGGGGTSSGQGFGGSGQPDGGQTQGTGGTGQTGCIPSGSATNPDQDSDGYSVAQGDCNDCDPLVNPGAVDVLQVDAMGNPLPNQVDQDCDGVLPTVANQECGDGLAIDSTNPMDAAKAMDICKVYDATKNSWGVMASDYETIDSQPLPNANAALGHGILPAFGPNVATELGPNLFALSSGSARRPGDPGFQKPVGNDGLEGGFEKNYTSNFLPGYPIEFSGCPGVMTGMPNDSVALRLVLKVPTNAQSFSFKLKFYTAEFPNYICSEFNDYVVVLMDPPPADVDQTNKNISFDSMHNPISVNNAFIDVCDPQTAGMKTFTCPAGNSQLQGTGFGADTVKMNHGGTSWLETTAPVVPGSTITLLFATWDSGDGQLDSTGLFDDFRWSATAAMGTGTRKP